MFGRAVSAVFFEWDISVIAHPDFRAWLTEEGLGAGNHLMKKGG